MSVIYKDKNKIYIDHCSYISNIYHKISVTDSQTETCELKRKLFYIFRDTKLFNRKRKFGNDELQNECSEVKAMYVQFLAELPNSFKECTMIKTDLPCSTSEVRKFAQNLFEATVFDHKGINGGNNSDTALRSTIKDEHFLIPPNSRFYCGCVSEQCKKLIGEKFDILIADPPWWNKYIRRLKNANNKLSYSMMYNEDIASIPVKNLLAPNCLIAVWCTNAPSNIDAVKNLIFPQWGVEYVTTWYWLKVTTDFEVLCDFGAGCKKQPYERIILGKVGDLDVPKKQLVVSVPSALHSHKPPLLELLSPYVNVPNPQSLELFARYLLPNTTSVGYEPLKWQHVSLYDKIS